MKERHSVRSYLDKPIDGDVRAELDAFVEEVNKESGLHITVRYDDAAAFDSKMAHYGTDGDESAEVSIPKQILAS